VKRVNEGRIFILEKWGEGKEKRGRANLGKCVGLKVDI